LPRSVDALAVWRQYNGRADLENRIKELGAQFGIKRLCVDNFRGTEAMHHLAIAAYNLCVLLQRRLGQLEKCELNTLRWRLFGRASVWSRARGKPTLKLTVHLNRSGLAGTIQLERVNTVWRACGDETKSSSRTSTGGGPNGAPA